MQREIKFRGQRYDDKTWIYGSLLEEDIIVTKGATDVDEDYIGFSDEWSSVLPETVGQYTGLKDKNGKEIYEGDLFHLGDRNILYVVEWHDCGLMGRQIRTRGSYVGLTYWQDKIEIIGNIHDNPELLEVQHE